MHIIEIIQIRLSEKYSESTITQIENHAKRLGLVKISIYRHATIETDLTVHIQHHSSVLNIPESGKTLASLVKEMGLVNHSIWVEFDHEDFHDSKKAD